MLDVKTYKLRKAQPCRACSLIIAKGETASAQEDGYGGRVYRHGVCPAWRLAKTEPGADFESWEEAASNIARYAK